MENIAHFFTKLMHNIEKIFPFPPVVVHKDRKTSLPSEKIHIFMRHKRNALTGT